MHFPVGISAGKCDGYASVLQKNPPKLGSSFGTLLMVQGLWGTGPVGLEIMAGQRDHVRAKEGFDQSNPWMTGHVVRSFTLLMEIFTQNF